MTEESVKALAAEDLEQHWWEMADERIEEYEGIFLWLPPDAFRFYYAAALSFTIQNWNYGGGACQTAFGAIQQGPKNLDEFTAEQLKFVAEALVELSCDPRGKRYEVELYSALRMIEQRGWKLAQLARGE